MKMILRIRELERIVRAAAAHISEMGCTCSSRANGHEPDCDGQDQAEKLLVRAGLLKREEKR